MLKIPCLYDLSWVVFNQLAKLGLEGECLIKLVWHYCLSKTHSQIYSPPYCTHQVPHLTLIISTVILANSNIQVNNPINPYKLLKKYPSSSRMRKLYCLGALGERNIKIHQTRKHWVPEDSFDESLIPLDTSYLQLLIGKKSISYNSASWIRNSPGLIELCYCHILRICHHRYVLPLLQIRNIYILINCLVYYYPQFYHVCLQNHN